MKKGPPVQDGLTATEVEFLFRELPFPVRHRWGGDANEFVEGIREQLRGSEAPAPPLESSNFSPPHQP